MSCELSICDYVFLHRTIHERLALYSLLQTPSSHPTNSTARASTLCGALLGKDTESQGLQSVDGRRLLLHPYRRRRADDHLLHAAAATARARVSHRSGCEYKAGDPTCEGLLRRTYRQHRTIKETLVVLRVLAQRQPP